MYEYACKVERVVDGDTIDVDLDLGFDIIYKCRVRLYGIDTPESRTRDKDEKARGKLAAKFLQDAISNGNHVILQTQLKDSKGKFGRVLASVIVDGIDINQQMIEKYMAVKYTGQSKQDIKLEHMNNRSKLIELGVYKPDGQGATTA